MPGQVLHLFLVGGNSFKTPSQKIEDGLVALKEKWVLIMKGRVTRF